MKQWYEELFENYGVKYDNENFAQGTNGECDFIEKEISYNKTARKLPFSFLFQMNLIWLLCFVKALSH